jgi:uncharacterized protein (DUF305 family)
MQITNKFWTSLLGLVMMAVLIAGCASSGTQAPDAGMDSMATEEVPNTGTTEFDQLFIDMMVPHHQGAVEMAKIAQERAEHPEIKEMADAIIAGQDEEIIQMKNWRQAWYGSSDTPGMSEMPSLEDMPGMGGTGHAMDMQAEVDQLRNASEPFDLAFIDAMIPHHQSAIDAAQRVLNEAQRPELKELAQRIIAAQEKEIEQMKAWRETWYPDALAPSSH